MPGKRKIEVVKDASPENVHEKTSPSCTMVFQGRRIQTTTMTALESRCSWPCSVFAAFMVAHFAAVAFGQRDSYEGPLINYTMAEVNDPVAKLARQVDIGRADLSYDDNLGYLPAVLKTLDVLLSSQTLVFSKTSLQLQTGE